MWNEPLPDNLSDWMLNAEYAIRIVAKVVRLPANFHRKVCKRLTEEGQIESSINLVLIIPLLGLPADSHQFFLIFLIKGKLFETRVFSCKKLGKCADSIVLKHIAQIRDMVNHAYLLNLIDRLSSIESDDKRAHCKMFSVPDVHSFLWNVHPSSAIAAIVKNVKIFESVELELSMLGGQTCSFYLQSQSVQLCIA